MNAVGKAFKYLDSAATFCLSLVEISVSTKLGLYRRSPRVELAIDATKNKLPLFSYNKVS